MPIHPIDFGKGLVSVTDNEAFFLDTNVIVSTLYENDSYHLACSIFLSFLIKNDVMLCVSETVIVEVINSLARAYYIHDEYDKYIAINGLPKNSREKRKLLRNFKINWSNNVIKQEPSTLQQYNKRAIERFKPLLDIFIVVPSDEGIIQNAFDISVHTPLASADAFIVSAAISPDVECRGIISVDKDLQVVFETEILATMVTNPNYDAAYMLNELEMVEFLYGNLGPADFMNKFPAVNIPIPPA